jgi:23S rRNA (pseudouridine1915-N3)-methyltransferase
LRIHLVAAGKLKPGPLKSLEQHYAGRITWPLRIIEVTEKRKLPPAELREHEAALLLKASPKDAVLVALDERGKALTSLEFSRLLGQWRDGGARDLVFLIGGAEGLSESVKRRAALVLSLGPATWPHFLARGMLLEQIYRAETLLAGHPYHRE